MIRGVTFVALFAAVLSAAFVTMNAEEATKSRDAESKEAKPTVKEKHWQMPEMRLKVGEPITPITLPDLDGKEHSLADYRGHKTLLFVFASW